MIFLVLAILSSTAVSIALRLSNDTQHSLYGKFVCNYIVCALLCAFISSSFFMGSDNVLFRIVEWVSFDRGLIFDAVKHEAKWGGFDKFIRTARYLCSFDLFCGVL